MAFIGTSGGPFQAALCRERSPVSAAESNEFQELRHSRQE
jgi:hypothetical protein